jgi:hypothetical protein
MEQERLIDYNASAALFFATRISGAEGQMSVIRHRHI